ncbi:MAG: adenosylcobalamin-dependent ribonucleoside-diphosphate reductase, partial [Deltaproteobacteria bacterium]|nr:adenosylcobalamin-dependent ribonucleoside-diphosphate reductase [Deltaproteobacteria bacterium]
RTKEIVSYKKAKEIFDLIALSAWKNGEPGVVFIDRINKANPTPHICEIEATNPCGEQPLLPYESCNLGSINMARMIKKGARGQGVKGSGDKEINPLNPRILEPLNPFNYEIDWDKLTKTIRLGVRFLDNVIDVNKYPLPQIEAITKGNRKIGLGIMGFADMLVKLRIPYDSEEAIAIAEKVMAFINKTAWETSQELADERGAFPNIKGSVFDKPDIKPVRNATTTTIAPTGTLSIIANCSSGIEPIYSLSYTREILEGQKLSELHPLLQEVAEEEGFFSDDLMDYISKGGSIDARKDVPEKIKNIFKTAFQIPVETHIKMQAVFQKYTDNAVSKTINLPNDAKPDDVKNAFLLAYKLGCKGVTVYRSGTRGKQALTCKETLYC